MRIAVVGADAVGSYYGTHLALVREEDIKRTIGDKHALATAPKAPVSEIVSAQLSGVGSTHWGWGLVEFTRQESMVFGLRWR
jgi:hypothetical protein